MAARAVLFVWFPWHTLSICLCQSSPGICTVSIPSSAGFNRHAFSQADRVSLTCVQCELPNLWRASNGWYVGRTTCSYVCTTTTPWTKSSTSRRIRTTSGRVPHTEIIPAPSAYWLRRQGIACTLLTPVLHSAWHCWQWLCQGVCVADTHTA